HRRPGPGRHRYRRAGPVRLPTRPTRRPGRALPPSPDHALHRQPATMPNRTATSTTRPTRPCFGNRTTPAPSASSLTRKDLSMSSPPGPLTHTLTPKWYSPAEVAVLLGFGLSKVKMLIATRGLRSVKDGKYRRILPERADEDV